MDFLFRFDGDLVYVDETGSWLCVFVGSGLSSISLYLKEFSQCPCYLPHRILSAQTGLAVYNAPRFTVIPLFQGYPPCSFRQATSPSGSISSQIKTTGDV
ncbi:hypothetical protein [uncultured Pseudomonas sp.]|uniref:hypothetical protein n=1 Tax=uncultured Pseudomonas sp. TaxID=114707 RepID=UPI0025CEB21C|nr:hypothetical protein [uncultured Pseudomonas sp.]